MKRLYVDWDSKTNDQIPNDFRRLKMQTNDDTAIPTEQTVDEYLEACKEAGKLIDPETADVTFSWEQVLDPYGVEPDLPAEMRQVGRVFFARSPDSDIWVWFGDLPYETKERLLEMHSSKLYFPAGLPMMGD